MSFKQQSIRSPGSNMESNQRQDNVAESIDVVTASPSRSLKSLSVAGSSSSSSLLGRGSASAADAESSSLGFDGGISDDHKENTMNIISGHLDSMSSVDVKELSKRIYITDIKLQKISDVLDKINTTMLKESSHLESLLKEKTELQQTLSRLTDIGLDYLERVIQKRKKIDGPLVYGSPYHVHPDGLEINAVMPITRHTYDVWVDTLTQTEYKFSCLLKMVVLALTKGGSCNWCPIEKEFQKIHHLRDFGKFSKPNDSKCIQGQLSLFGALEERGFFLRKTQGYMAVQRQYMDPRKVDNLSYASRTVLLQCRMKDFIPYNVPGVVTFYLHDKVQPVHGHAMRSQRYDTDKLAQFIDTLPPPPKNAVKVASRRMVDFDESILQPSLANTVPASPVKASNAVDISRYDSSYINIDYYRYVIENEANKQSAYEKDSKKAEHIVCSRGVFGTVDGSLLAEFAKYYVLQGFDKIVFYDVGVSTINHPEALADAIEKGYLLWIDLKPWLHRNYGYLAIDLILFSKSVAQMLTKYDCHFRAKNYGTKWVLHVDPDELLFQGALGWNSGWEKRAGMPIENPPPRNASTTIVDMLRNVPESVSHLTFGSLPSAKDNIFCKSTILWSSWSDILKKVDDIHINVESKDIPKYFHWDKNRCASAETCAGPPASRKILIRPTKVTIPVYMGLHEADCSGYVPWKEDIVHKEGINLSVKVGYIRHIRCLNHFGKENKWTPKGTWFMYEVHKGGRGGL